MSETSYLITITDTVPTWGSTFLNHSLVHYWLDNIKCDGTEESLLDCEYEALGYHNCRDDEIAGVECKHIRPLVCR